LWEPNYPDKIVSSKVAKVKKIGVTLRIVENQTYHESRDALSHDWITFFDRLKLIPVLIPNCLEEPVEYFINNESEGLILTNGEDVALKGKKNNEFNGSMRDVTEVKLISYAIRNSIPVLGVCRGMQFINIYFGGKLIDGTKGHVTESHQIEIIDKKYQDFLSNKTIKTNSYHNIGIVRENLAEDLIPWAIKDNVVEALYHKKFPVTAIQWHPERKNPAAEIDRKLFSLFLNRKLFS
jgi:putative glutamine amidotransferase